MAPERIAVEAAPVIGACEAAGHREPAIPGWDTKTRLGRHEMRLDKRDSSIVWWGRLSPPVRQQDQATRMSGARP
jgi:hypothetical protein